MKPHPLKPHWHGTCRSGGCECAVTSSAGPAAQDGRGRGRGEGRGGGGGGGGVRGGEGEGEGEVR